MCLSALCSEPVRFGRRRRNAGIDHSTAYARRKAHVDSAAAWDDALATHREGVRRAEAEAVEAVGAGSTLPLPDSPPAKARGAELVGAGRQMKRAGHDRWSERKEKLFFDELAATANVKRAAKAAGVSPNAVYARRMKDRRFRTKWAAVLESGRAAIEMKLVEAANKSFDPEDIDTGGVEPKVSVTEAIRIVQLHGTKAQRDALPSFEEQANAMGEHEVEALREGIVRKLERLYQRDKQEKLGAGWSHDEDYERLIPPGWVRAP